MHTCNVYWLAYVPNKHFLMEFSTRPKFRSLFGIVAYVRVVRAQYIPLQTVTNGSKCVLNLVN